MVDYKRLAGKDINGLNPYKPGKPIDEVKKEYGLDNVIKMASNENPYGPSPKAQEAVKQACDSLSLYPFGDAYYIRQILSSKLGINPSELVFGSGSNEIIELLLRTFVKPGEHVISPSPSFSVYGIISQAMGSRCVWVDTKDDFNIDFDSLIKAVTDKTRVCFIANPNNPTGTYVNEAQLIKFLNTVPKDLIIVMDEAYIEYASAYDIPDTVKLLKKYNNLVIMRTFSKAYGLAGLRMGYAVACADCCDMLNRVRQPFNTSSIAQVAAIQALQDEAYLEKIIYKNNEGRNYLYNEFDHAGLSFIKSEANFILVNVGDGEKVFNGLLEKGVIVRYMGSPLEKYIRVTVGTEDENKVFIRSLKEVIKTS